MCKKRTILIFATLLWGLNLWGQGFFKTFQQPGGSFTDAFETADGGFFAVGGVDVTSKVLASRVAPNGQTVFHQVLSINGALGIAACPAADGGYIVLGKNYADVDGLKNVVVKLDVSGQIVWQKVIGNLPYLPNGLQDIIKTTDGQYLLVGETRNASYEQQVWLVRLATDGAEVWNKQISSAVRAKKVLELPTGNFIMQGEKELMKVAADGTLLWTKQYNAPVLMDMARSDDDGIVVLSDLSQVPNVGLPGFRVFKTDWNGELIWSRVVQVIETNIYPFSMAIGSNANVYVSMVPFYDPSENTVPLYELNEDGFLLAKIPIEPKIEAYKLLATANNHLCMVGAVEDLQLIPAILKTDFQGNYLSNKISGQVYKDLNGNCVKDPGEPGFKDVIVKAFNAVGEAYYKQTDADGNYQIRVSNGDFWVTANPIYGPANFYALCNQQQVSVSGSGAMVNANPTGIQVTQSCSLIEVEVGAGLLRRCTTATYTVSYCNIGNLTGTNVVAKITKDSKLSYQSSSIPLSASSGNGYDFSLPDLLPGACGSFNIQFNVACDATTALGDVLCVDAEIVQAVNCFIPNPGGDGATLVASGTCLGNQVRFKIKNVGSSGTAEYLNYVILEDQIMLSPVPFSLGSGEELEIVHATTIEDSCIAIRILPNTTSTLSKPIAVVENCNSANGNLNLLLQLPNNENDPNVAVHCDAIVGSFDPNDKRGFPLGLGNNHYIKRGDELEYMIRFQNTGNDTAFLVVIRDQLPPELDASTIRPISASHAYTWDVSDQGMLTFTFPNILLVDSTTNETNSHGYVMFRVAQKPFLQEETKIMNNAAIYFDFNEAILTNTSLHTIGSPITSKVSVLTGVQLDVKVTPNPFKDQSLVQVNGEMPRGTLHFTMYDALGRTCVSEYFEGRQYLLHQDKLSAGVYFFQISTESLMLSTGRLVIKQ